ncbi:MAG: SLBB domain-containing protein [Deltaproteobacteria bacterium]|nr:SLBB domain-containing protein [Deltaproteobacteria bacterium]
MNRFALWICLPLLLCQGVSSRAADTGNYLVGPGDVLRVSVYGNPDLNTTARVSGEGTILFPLLGEIRIGKMTVSEVSDTLARKLADGYIVNPQVSVFVEDFRSKKAIIIGPVKNPGLYELSGPTTLMELISKAGGLLPEAGHQLTIKRKGKAGKFSEQPITINLKNLLEKGEAALDVPIMDGDTINIGKAGVVYVTGEVRRPAAYQLEDNTSVLKAITMAGGFTNLASKGRVKIIRKSDGKEKVIYRAPLDTPVKPEDVIVVPESFF